MQYAVLVYETPEHFSARTDSGAQAYWDAYAAYSNVLVEADAMRGGSALKSTEEARTLTVRQGQVNIVDGPYADTREQLGGFFLIEADNLDEAMEMAQQCPSVKGGSAELRPLETYTGPAEMPDGSPTQATHAILIYDNEHRWDGLDEASWREAAAPYFTYTDSLRDAGKMVSGEPLQATQTATTFRENQDGISIIDGPYAETREQFGGFYLLSLPDADAAELEKIAADCPAAHTGHVEIRPVWPMN